MYLSCRFSSHVANKSRNIWDMHTCSSLFQCNFSWIQVEIVWWIFTECRVWRYMYWLKCYWTSWPGIFHFMGKCDKLRSRFCKMVCWKFWADYSLLFHTHFQQLTKAAGSHGSYWSLLFVKKVMVWQVMTALTIKIPSNCWRYLCIRWSVFPSTTESPVSLSHTSSGNFVV
jgi:hypothetical protein